MLNLLDKVNKMEPLAGGLYTFILGMVVVFLGIAILVLCVSLFGKLIQVLEKKSEKPKKQQVKVEEKVEQETANSDDIPEHVKVAIIAAISAYYQTAQEKCDFVVKKIKRF